MRDNPTLIVTGASRGIGAAVARIAAQWGANVVLTARSVEKLHSEMQKILAAGGRAFTVRGELSQEDDCRAIVQQTLDHFGRINGLVNSGGIIDPMTRIAEANFQEWERNWAVNVLGPVMLTQMALPYLRQSQGRVINISTGAAVKVVPGWGAYSIAKAAINHFTCILAGEEPSIVAIAVRPGRVDSDMQATVREKGKTGMLESMHRQFVEEYEQGKLLPPEKPGRAIAWLALYAPHEWSGEFIEWDDARIPLV